MDIQFIIFAIFVIAGLTINAKLISDFYDLHQVKQVNPRTCGNNVKTMKKVLYIVQAIIGLPLIVIGYLCIVLLDNIVSRDNSYLDKIIDLMD